jgi:cell pole-organizing protein PopZ
MQQAGEPSVEEILDSIKKVIARDNRDAVASDRRERSTKTATVKPVAATAAQAHNDDAAAEHDESESAEVLELDALDAIEESVEAADEPIELETIAPEVEDQDDAAPSGLTDEKRASAMRDNFAALAMLAQPSKEPQIVRSGETSLEELTRQLLRPMLAEWLDENLPDMVEELVKAEISRIAGKKDS